MATDDDAPPKPERDDRQDRQDRQDRDEKYRDGLPETIRQRLEHLVPELVKKTFAAGMGAVFSTEEGIRKLARENIPEVAGYLAHSADGAKDKVFEVIARETREFLSNLNLTDEIAKILTTLSFEIKTEIRFIPNSERLTGAEPDVKASVRLKRNDKQTGTGDGKDVSKDAKDAAKDAKDGRDGKDAKDARDTKGEGELDAGRDSRSRLRFWRRDAEGGGGGEGDGGDTGDK